MSERDLAKLLALVEKQLGRGWVEVVDWLRDQNDLASLESRLLAGDFSGIVAQIEDAARRFAAEAHHAFVTSGRRAAELLDADVPHALIRFDQTNDRAVRRAQQNELELVSGLTREQQGVIRNVMVDAQRNGTNPNEWARDIRQSIGLTENQAAAVTSYRRALETGDYTNALGRELRDGRADRSLAAARRDSKLLAPDRVDSLVDRYRRNFVAYRAETVARTESQRNVHEGIEELYAQAVERGEVVPGELECVWNAGPKTRYARPDHQRMNGKAVPFGEDFVLPDGVRMKYPGDPRGGAEHNANCRCTKSTKYTAKPGVVGVQQPVPLPAYTPPPVYIPAPLPAAPPPPPPIVVPHAPTPIAPAQPPATGVAFRVADALAIDDHAAAILQISDDLLLRGLSPVDIPNKAAMPVEMPVGDHGFRQWDGTITVSHDVAKNAKSFMKKYSEDPEAVRAKLARMSPQALFEGGSSEEADLAHGLLAHKTYTHEAVHGYGPMRASTFIGPGAAVEEVATELTARRIMRDQFGVSLKTGQGSYGKQIFQAVDAVRDVHPEISEEDAWDLLEHASLTFKQQRPGGDLVDIFASALAGLTHGKSNDIAAALRKRLSL